MSRAIGSGADKRAFYDRVGQAVRAQRMKAGLSQRGLAAAIGSSTTTTTNIENGAAMPSFYQAALIAEACDCTLDDLAPVVIDAAEAE